jgi:CO/xanthine dehydrogenase FAD-binding subunit
MIPAKFDYVRPASLDEAVAALASGGCGWPTPSCWSTWAA